MRINPHSILPSHDVLIRCRDGLTNHIKETKAKKKFFKSAEFAGKVDRKQLDDKIYRLTTIRKEIQFLIESL